MCIGYLEADELPLQADLDISVERGLWATQRHNEGVLDQAYRTAKDVYLIFSVNRSGEFFGYARYAFYVLVHRRFLNRIQIFHLGWRV